MPDVFIAPESEKSAVQKRMDAITRAKYEALRSAAASAAEASELRTANMRLAGELGELRNELQQAKSLLQAYRVELEKYRSKLVEIAATKEKPKHAR